MGKLTECIRSEHLKLLEKVDTSRAAAKRIQESKVRRLIKEEFDAVLGEIAENAPEIGTKLETMRKKLIADNRFSILERGGANHLRGSRPERRIPLESVSRMIDVPVDNLILHFLNGHRIHEGVTNLVEYRLGTVCFYADDKELAK